MNETTVKRHRAPSGNRDADYFQAVCTCGWPGGGVHSNRTVEGRRLAERDAADHQAAQHPSQAPACSAHSSSGARPSSCMNCASAKPAQDLLDPEALTSDWLKCVGCGEPVDPHANYNLDQHKHCAA